MCWLFKKKADNEKAEIEELLSKKFKEITLTYTKRKVDNYPDLLPMNVCDFVRRSETIDGASSVREIWSIPLTYVSDNFNVNGVPDYWQIAEETDVIKKGDCEDLGAYRHTLANNAGHQNIFSCIGYWNGQGHFFNVMIDKAVLKDVGFIQSVLLLEPTSNQYALELLENKPEYQVVYLFNDNKCWYIDGTQSKVKKDFGVK